MNDLVDGVKIEGKVMIDGGRYLRSEGWIRRFSEKKWGWYFSAQSISDEHL